MLSSLREAQSALQLAVEKYVESYTTILASHNFQIATDHARCNISLAREESQHFTERIKSRLSYADTLLKRVQNQCIPFNLIPSELLVQIFQHAINHPNRETRFHSRVWPRVRHTTLLSAVCSHWRKIITQTSLFWSQIPLGQTEASKSATLLYLERAQGRPIAISAILLHPRPWRGKSALVRHAQQIRTLSIFAEIPQIKSIMECMQHLESPSSLKELSVERFANFGSPPTGIFEGSPHVALRTSFSALAKNLQTLRLEGVYLDWFRFTFDKLEVLKLGWNGGTFSLDQLAHIAATSPGLRILELRSLSLDNSQKDSQPIIQLPSLQSLCLRYLKLDVLCAVLGSLSPGSYSTQVFIDDYCFEFQVTNATMDLPEESIDEGMRRLKRLFQMPHNITTLGLRLNDAIYVRRWLLLVLQMVPRLNTLHFERTHLTSRELFMITRPQNEESHATVDHLFPAIHTIRMQDVRITDLEAFKSMVASYPIQCMDMRACWIPSRKNVYGYAQVDSTCAFYQWLSQRIPRMTLSRYDEEWDIQ